MFRLREFEIGDLDGVARELPHHADAVEQLREHPGGLHGVIVHDVRDRIAGCLVAAGYRLATNTRTIGLGAMRIAHIGKELRIGGIHSLLLEMDADFSERFEGAEKAFQAMVAQWHEEDVWCLRRLRDYEPVAQSLTYAGPVTQKVQLDGVAITKFDPADAGLPFDDGPEAGVMRTAAMLHHGAQLPGREAWVARRDDRVVAWAVRRTEGDEAVLEDHWIDWREQDLAAAMLIAVASERASLRVTRWSHHEHELAALQTAGLRIRGPERLVAARVSAFGIAPSSLAEFASLGERDVGAACLPQLSHNELITTPPPPGTQSTRGDHRRSSKNRKIASR